MIDETAGKRGPGGGVGYSAGLIGEATVDASRLIATGYGETG